MRMYRFSTLALLLLLLLPRTGHPREESRRPSNISNAVRRIKP